jgi:hypothetical protein
MSALVAIDPGFARRGKGCAVAVFAGQTLVRACFERPESVRPESLRVGATHVVWECPQVDARTRTSAPAVIQLAAVGGMLAGMFAGACGCHAEPVAPLAWKGSTPKPVHHGRMWAQLSDDERRVLGGADTLKQIEAAKRRGALDRWGKPGAAYYPAAWLVHNLLDAVGLGLWRLGRWPVRGEP